MQNTSVIFATAASTLAFALVACTQQPPPLRRVTPTPTLVLPTATPTPIPTPTPVPTPTPTPDPVLARLRLELREAFPRLPDFVEAREAVPNLPDTKLSLLTHLTHAGDGTNRLWVTDKAGIVYVFDNKPDVDSFTPFLDLRDHILENDPEQGLLGLAFDPDYRANGYFYVNYTADTPLRSVVSRFTAKPSTSNVADPSSELVLLEVPQPMASHNGGTLVFGPDGYLYGTFGEGGYLGSHGPSQNSQDRSNLLGTVIRIDVRTATAEQPYRIPTDNPFVGVEGARPEIWAYGLRNPWKMSFDPSTGTVWTADAGDVTWEEVDVLRAGANYGWPIREGPDCFPQGTTGCATEGLEPPLFAYHTLPPWCTVIGGHVYRGKRVAGLQGAYVYADFCGLVRAIRLENRLLAGEAVLVQAQHQITSFGVDEAGELYVLAGRVYHLAARE